MDVGTGELLILGAIGFALVGRKDLPRVSRAAGAQLGRIVGFLQGARARADRMTQSSQLQKLQVELKKGLREIDAVRSELAIAATYNRGFGTGLTTGDKVMRKTVEHGSLQAAFDDSAKQHVMDPLLESSPSNSSASSIPSTTSNVKSTLQRSLLPSTALPELAPRARSVAAIAEESWKHEGIDFKARAEGSGGSSGSSILNDVIQQSLIYDQYDRVMMEQEEALEQKVDNVKQRVVEKSKNE